jgi:RNA polymerase sigma-70 factor (ECF subfamily)
MYNARALQGGIWASLIPPQTSSAKRTAARPARIKMSSAIELDSADRPGTTWAAKSDEELLLEHRLRRTRAAFEELVRRYERELYSYLRRYLSDATLAEDVFQATFLQLYLKAEQFEEGRKVRPWLYTIATNQAIDAQRRNKRHKMVSLDRRGYSHETQDNVGTLLDLLTSKEPEATDNLETDERRQWVQQAIANLPEPLREAVLLVYYQGLKYREAAAVLDIPVGTVKSRMHAAILKLTEAWTENHPSTDD